MTGHDHGGDPAGPSLAVLAALAVPLLLLGVYLLAVRRQRRGGGAWSRWRTASFGTGAALLGVGLAVPAHDAVGHMWQHLLVGMLAPLGLVLGAPGTLALRALDRETGRATVRLLAHPVPRLLAHPVTGLLLTTGGLYALYLTPLYRATLAAPALHWLVAAHFLASGCLFTWSIAGPDPGPHRPRVPVRLVVLGVAVAAHAALAQLLYAGLLVDVPGTVGQLHAAASIMYYGGDLAEILLALALLATWRPERRRIPRPRPATTPHDVAVTAPDRAATAPGVTAPATRLAAGAPGGAAGRPVGRASATQ
ncbi:cytochrome c oxidase assembly protein [Micromonospora cathayae]|uniref:Cytochrome c oxidase assembly protein n=1 Tax=Micromonospora cathayae TaxID=3028804 RepID=A0ABY7ZHL9_9ACTN|nr:cytochrome c oxidase assembly protein [Micromonospora sp. HUAS 3]WDZ82322.1 cytochrome c oxidase assembly protein [Micromonospora sp. HUAS 3]